MYPKIVIFLWWQFLLWWIDSDKANIKKTYKEHCPWSLEWSRDRNFSNSTTYQITNIRKPWTLNRFSSLSLCVSKLGNQRFTWSFFNSVDDDDVALIIHYFQVDLDFRNTAKFPYLYFVWSQELPLFFRSFVEENKFKLLYTTPSPWA